MNVEELSETNGLSIYRAEYSATDLQAAVESEQKTIVAG
jgi:hypothetical protein